MPAALPATLPTVIGVHGARHNDLQDVDLDLLAADHLIDMGPGGGPDGGHILAAGTPEDVACAPGSATGPWLAEHLSLPEAGHHDVLSHAQTG